LHIDAGSVRASSFDHLFLSPSVAGRLAAASVDRQVRGWEKAGRLCGLGARQLVDLDREVGGRTRWATAWPPRSSCASLWSSARLGGVHGEDRQRNKERPSGVA